MISPTVERIQLAPGFWSSLRRLGIEARDIARQAQLPTSLIQQPSFTIEPYFAIWQAYSDLIGDVGTAIVKLATAFETAHYPPSALSTFHARLPGSADSHVTLQAVVPSGKFADHGGGRLLHN